MKRKRAPNGAALKLVEAALKSDADDCMFWPYTKTPAGYGRLYQNGRMEIVNRVLLSRAVGAPPTSKHQAAHSCGRGHLGCYNPKHLRWATATENAADRIAHGTDTAGTRNPMSKVDNDTVSLIREMAPFATGAMLSRQFGISQTQVSRIVNSLHWRGV